MVRDMPYMGVVGFVALTFLFLVGTFLVSVSGDDNSGKIDLNVLDELEGEEEVTVRIEFKEEDSRFRIFSESVG